jgi:hypothetical protein
MLLGLLGLEMFYKFEQSPMHLKNFTMMSLVIMTLLFVWHPPELLHLAFAVGQLTMV